MSAFDCLSNYNDMYESLNAAEAKTALKVLKVKLKGRNKKELSRDLVRLIYHKKWIAVKVLIDRKVKLLNITEYEKPLRDMLAISVHRPPDKDELMVLLYLFPDEDWDLEQLAQNDGFFPISVGDYHISKHIMSEIEYRFLSSNINLTVPWVREQIKKGKKFNHTKLSRNQAFFLSDIKNNPDLKWVHTQFITHNPNSRDYQEKIEGIEESEKPEEFLTIPLEEFKGTEHLGKKMGNLAWEVLASRKDLTEYFILKHIKDWDRLYLLPLLSLNLYIPFEVIKRNISLPWDFMDLFTRYDVDYQWMVDMFGINDAGFSISMTNSFTGKQMSIGTAYDNPAVPLSFFIDNIIRGIISMDIDMQDVSIFRNPNITVAYVLYFTRVLKRTKRDEKDDKDDKSLLQDEIIGLLSANPLGNHKYFRDIREAEYTRDYLKTQNVFMEGIPQMVGEYLEPPGVGYSVIDEERRRRVVRELKDLGIPVEVLTGMIGDYLPGRYSSRVE